MALHIEVKQLWGQLSKFWNIFEDRPTIEHFWLGIADNVRTLGNLASISSSALTIDSFPEKKIEYWKKLYVNNTGNIPLSAHVTSVPRIVDRPLNFRTELFESTNSYSLTNNELVPSSSFLYTSYYAPKIEYDNIDLFEKIWCNAFNDSLNGVRDKYTFGKFRHYFSNIGPTDLNIQSYISGKNNRTIAKYPCEIITIGATNVTVSNKINPLFVVIKDKAIPVESLTPEIITLVTSQNGYVIQGSLVSANDIMVQNSSRVSRVMKLIGISANSWNSIALISDSLVSGTARVYKPADITPLYEDMFLGCKLYVPNQLHGVLEHYDVIKNDKYIITINASINSAEGGYLKHIFAIKDKEILKRDVSNISPITGSVLINVSVNDIVPRFYPIDNIISEIHTSYNNQYKLGRGDAVIIQGTYDIKTSNTTQGFDAGRKVEFSRYLFDHYGINAIDGTTISCLTSLNIGNVGDVITIGQSKNYNSTVSYWDRKDYKILNSYKQKQYTKYRLHDSLNSFSTSAKVIKTGIDRIMFTIDSANSSDIHFNRAVTDYFNNSSQFRYINYVNSLYVDTVSDINKMGVLYMQNKLYHPLSTSLVTKYMSPALKTTWNRDFLYPAFLADSVHYFLIDSTHYLKVV